MNYSSDGWQTMTLCVDIILCTMNGFFLSKAHIGKIHGDGNQVCANSCG
jgi:hypothetical protein